jgi:hypothetical protein
MKSLASSRIKNLYDTSRGSVIDFVMHREGVNLGGARKVLREWLGTPNPSFPIARRVFARPKPVSRDRAGLFAEWQKDEGLQASPHVSQQLAEQLELFLHPLLMWLDRLVDKRLVRTFPRIAQRGCGRAYF